jgi:FMN phosphatase YigB (HAD superfamily)
LLRFFAENFQFCAPMTPVKNIIFDFGNVLFDLDLPAIERHFRQLFGKNFDAVNEKLRCTRFFELYETGGISTEEFVATLRTATDSLLSEEQVVAAWNSIFIDMPKHRFDMLLQLRQRYQVFLLSNINDLHANWIDAYMLRQHGMDDFLTRHFDAVYYSHLIRLRKPDREIYEYVLADAELVAEETVFFDDLEVNIEAAKQLGIRGVLHPAGREIGEAVSALVSDRRSTF